MIRATAVLLATLAAQDPQMSASAHFEEGLSRFDQGEIALALEHFESANDLAPHPATEFHIGRCKEELGRLKEAIEHYRRVESAEAVSPREKATAVGRRRLLEKQLATLRIQAPGGVRVFVDDAQVCVAKCDVTVDPGQHEVRALLPSGTQTKPVTAEPGTAVPVLFSPPTPAATDRRAPPKRKYPTALTWAGIPIAAVGVASTIGFSVRAKALNDDFMASADDATRSDGRTMQALANASIAVAALGGILIVADAIRYSVVRRRGDRSQTTATLPRPPTHHRGGVWAGYWPCP